MGRLSRKRKVKAMDPFSKTGGVVSTPGNKKGARRDLAPRGGDEDDRRGMRRLPRGLKPAGMDVVDERRVARKRRRDEELAGRAPKRAPQDPAKPAAEAKPKVKAAPVMAQLERQPGESLRKFKTRLRDAAKVAMQANLESGAGFRRVSDSRRSYMNRKSAHEKNKAAARLVRKAEAKPGLGMDLLSGLHGRTVLPTSDTEDEDAEPAASLIPRDVAIEQAVLARADAGFGDRVFAPPELRPTGRLARLAPARRTATVAEKMLLSAGAARARKRREEGGGGAAKGEDGEDEEGEETAWQGGLHRRERAAAAAASAKAAGDGADRTELARLARLAATRAEVMAAYTAARQRKAEAARRGAEEETSTAVYAPGASEFAM